MKINLIANELKKIYKLRYVAVAASVFLLFGYFLYFRERIRQLKNLILKIILKTSLMKTAPILWSLNSRI